MELQDIQEKINNLLAGTERKIVFGYDDDASYADDIDALQLEDGCKVLKLTGRKEEIYRIIIGSSNITSAALTKNKESQSFCRSSSWIRSSIMSPLERNSETASCQRR